MLQIARRSRLAAPGTRAAATQAARRCIWGLAEKSEAEADLTVPLENIDCPPPLFDATTATQVTKLPNGLTVASSDMSAPGATVGVYVDTGSAYEAVSGTSYMLQHMAFKASAHYSHTSFVRTAERLGAVNSAAAGRENMVYQTEALKSSVPECVDMLASTVFEPNFLPWELEEAKGIAKQELEEYQNNHQLLLQELSHTAAYGAGSPLGKPLMAARTLPHVDVDACAKFVEEQYVPSRMVLAAAGVDHADLVEIAKASPFGRAAAGLPQSHVKTEYVGGEYREHADEPLTHFALTFKGCGWNDKDLVPICVLNTMMGGGFSFSAGGPGKGMYTRLYQNILNNYGYCHAASVFASFYNGTGLFGVYAAAPPEQTGQVFAAIVNEMKNMGNNLTDAELSRAKSQLTTSLLFNLESRAIVFEDIGRQVLTYGARKEPAELVAQIAAVTAADISRVASSILKSTPSVAVYGDTTCVPRYDLIAKQF